MVGKVYVSEIKRDPRGGYREKNIGSFNGIRIVFGPHYFIELHRTAKGPVTFILGATHHGFKADASEVGGELEQFIEVIRRLHPANAVD